MVDKRKRYLAQHPTNAVPVTDNATQQHYGTEMSTSPALQVPGQELDPTLAQV